MKKIIFATVACGIASVASAQSSLVLFGVMDATIAHGSGSIADKTQLTSSGYGSSRLGFRGSEDLGGGLAASFWLEAALINDDGTGAASNTNNQASGNPPASLVGGQGVRRQHV